MRLIDADAAIDALNHMRSEDFDGLIVNRQKVESMLKALPSVQPERKKAKWIDGQCSNCGCDIPAYIIDWKWQKDMDANYCPNCGADMRNVKDESKNQVSR